MNKIAFIGPKSYYQSFRLMGCACFEAENGKEAKEIIKKIKEEGLSLIFTTEDILFQGEEGVVSLPGIKKKEGKEALEKQVERALGGAVSGQFLESK